jgi:tetratricopeptide (TPR) repeat protein
VACDGKVGNSAASNIVGFKTNLLDKFSKSGRLRDKLNELVRSAECGQSSRMDAGDQIGRQIVANLVTLARREPEESQLLFDAQRTRAQLYQQSAGAAPVEAAEALSEAHATIKELGANGAAALSSLVPVASAILTDLLQIGSKRNAWNVARILLEAVESSPEHKHERPRVVDGFVALVKRILTDRSDPGVLGTLLSLCDWAKKEQPKRVAELTSFIPALLGMSLGELDADLALHAYLYARHIDVDFEPALLGRLVLKLASERRIDTEARLVFQELLHGLPDRRGEIEKTFEDLAFVNPDHDVRFDPDLDSLNTLLSESYAEAGWVWRNRGLLFRKKGDPIGAIACLARSLTITGNPPELMGLLSPILHGMGFEYAAREFARFVPAELHQRFQLQVLEDLVDEPGTDERRRELLARYERSLKRANVQPEFLGSLRVRRAQALYELGELAESCKAWREVLDIDPTHELAALKIAEIWTRQGEMRRAGEALRARFSPWAMPLVEHLRSRIAEAAGDPAAAAAHNDAALAALGGAQEAGRDKKMKNIAVLAERAQRLFGEDIADGALFSMLQVEAHATRHYDLDLLAPILERRAVELSLRSGNTDTARRVIRDLVKRRPADTDIYVHGIRASLRADSLDEAAEFLGHADESGHGGSVEVSLLRGILAWMKKDKDGARAGFEAALGRVPTAEARLGLAAVHCEDGREALALEVLTKARAEEGGMPEIRARLFDLRGRLLERAGRTAEAYQSYVMASEALPGWSDARRRAGLLGVQAALDAAGRVRDAEGLRRALGFLEGYNDPEAVVHASLAKAALETAPAAAAALLGTQIKRVSARHAAVLHVSRTRCLLDAGERAAARSELESLLEESDARTAPELIATAKHGLAGILRHDAAQALLECPAQPAKALDAAIELLESAERSAPTASGGTLLSLAVAARHAKESMPAAGAVDGELAPLRALVHMLRGEPLPADLTEACRQTAREAGDPATAAISKFVTTLADPAIPAADLMNALAGLSSAGVPHPCSAASVRRTAAIRALAAEDATSLDRVLAAAMEDELGDVRALRNFEQQVERGDGADAQRLVQLFHELEQHTRGGAVAPELAQRMAKIQARLTALREQPSPAWASAKLRCAGKRTRVVVPEVLRFWEEERSKGRNVGDALHVLALMRLARAHEAETSAMDMTAWQEAHAAWSAFLAHDGYWNTLAERCEREAPGQGKKVAARVRQEIPRWLLTAHLAHAKARMHTNQLATAINHGRLVASSPLLAPTDGRLRDELCLALAVDLERLLHTKRYEDALACLDHVVVCDPTNPLALREIARVAAAAVGQSLAVLDALTSPPQSSMLNEISALMSRVLIVAERPLRELAAGGPHPPALAQDVVTALRALAYVAYNRDRQPARAAEAIDLALGVARAHGLETGLLLRFRTEVGLAQVEKTMQVGAAAASSQSAGGADPLEHALLEVDRLLELDPDNPKVITHKTRLLIARNRDAEAEQLARDLFLKAQKKAEPAIVRAAVELLYQVQAGRERFRYDSKMQLVDELLRERNWRDALLLFKEAVAGRENEVPHQIKHIEILLGLHRTERLEELLVQLEKTKAEPEVARRLRARFECLVHVLGRGGDLLSAFELQERGDTAKAIQIAGELARTRDDDGVGYLVLAFAHAAAQDAAAATRCSAEAKRRATRSRLKWVDVLSESVPEKKS